MKYYSLNNYLRDLYGQKVYKIAIDGGFTCPNRDGTKGNGGCIFCSGLGSGEFTGNRTDGEGNNSGEPTRLSIYNQIENGKLRVISKLDKDAMLSPKFIAYFQSYTGTYAPVSELEEKYMEAINHPDVVGLSIATRPDCLPSEVIGLIAKINNIKPVWIELGLQTIHEETASYIRRGYELPVYDEAVRKLADIGVHIVTHVILGLPGETEEMMLETVRYVGDMAKKYAQTNCEQEANLQCECEQVGKYNNYVVNETVKNRHKFGIKLQLLHIIKGTDLENEYNLGRVKVLTMEEYTSLVAECIGIIPKDVVIHRLTGDGDKRTLVAPLWSGDKKKVLNLLNSKINNM